IGNFSCISHNAKIGLDNHKLNALSINPLFYDERKGIVKNDFSKELKPTIICSDVLISANASILSGLKLSVGCIVGANSFVNRDVPPYAIVAGTPAKIIGYRFQPDLIEELLKTKWWEKSFDQ